MTTENPHIHGTPTPAAEFQRCLGAYLDQVISGDVITITRWRRPAAVVVSAAKYEALLADHQEMEKIRAKRRRKG